MRLVLILGALVVGLFLALGASPAFAAPGDLDTAFSHDGKVLVRFGKSKVAAADAAVFPNGKVAVLGNASATPTQFAEGNSFVLARLRVNGKLDRSFSRNGRVKTKIGDASFAIAVASQPDGKLVVSGSELIGEFRKGVLVRYDASGSLDSSFGTNGRVVTPEGFSDLAIQPDGKIVGVGAGVVTRFLPNGSVDPSFSETRPTVETDADWRTLILRPDGGIVVAGSTFPDNTDQTTANAVIARYTEHGDLDDSFADHGVLEYGNGESVFTVAVDLGAQADRRTVVLNRVCAGDPLVHSNNCGAYLSRLSPDGAVDNTFGANGQAFLDISLPTLLAGLQVQDDGRILVGLSALRSFSHPKKKIGLTRLDIDGLLDSSFAGDGTATAGFKRPPTASALELAPGTRALLAGTTKLERRFVLARFELDG